MAFSFNPLDWFGGGQSSGGSSEDVLAPIRQQLLDLASQVPGIIAGQRSAVEQGFETARKRGRQGIAEEMRANRGFGDSSIEPMYNTMAEADLEAKKAAALSGLDISGLNLESGLLSKAAGIRDPYASLYDSLYQSMGESAATDEDMYQFPIAQKLFSGQGEDIGIEDWAQELKNLPTYIQAVSTLAGAV